MDYTKYIGLPYVENGRTEHGTDCWGLVRLFYRNELNIDLPSYIEDYLGANDPCLPEFVKHSKSNWIETKSPKTGDVCVFNILGEPTHVGLYLDKSKFLHSRDGKDSVIESLDSHKWNRRLEGIYTYNTSIVPQIIAKPHPLRQTTILEVAQAGTSCAQFAKYLIDKYNLGKHIASRLIIMIDGQIINRDRWNSTYLEAGQTITYKTVPQGREGLRLALTFAIAIAAPYVAGTVFGLQAGTVAYVAATAAIQVAGMALLNAVLPIRPPEQKDPGSPVQLGLFTGSNNQANKFGPIPVVLGRIRYTGLLGATPYIKTKTNTTVLNLVIVWGFGPLNVRDICIGANQIADYYQDNLPGLVPTPVTLYGSTEKEDYEGFDKLYPTDVQVATGSNSVELVNTAATGNPWTEATFTDPVNSIDVAFNFPEGMRQIITKGENSGDSREATCQLEIQLKKYYLGDSIQDQAWTNTSADNSPAYTLQGEYRSVLPPAVYNNYELGESTPLWRKHVFCLGPNGVVVRFDGSASDQENGNPTQTLQTNYFTTNYASLLSSSGTFLAEPVIPNGFVKLYSVTIFGSSGIQAGKTINHLTSYYNQGYAGLGLGYENSFYPGVDPLITDSISDVVIIAKGQLTQLITGQPTVSGVVTEVFNTRQLLDVEPVSASILNIKAGIWGEFINIYGVWTTAANQAQTFDKTKVLNLARSGIYKIEFSSDDNGQVLLDGALIIDYPKGGHGSWATVERYISSGTHSLQLTASNSQGGAAGIACRVTFTDNVGQNSTPSTQNIITIGASGFFEKQKDAFNYVHEFKNLNAKPQSSPIAITASNSTDDTYTCSSVAAFTVGDRIRFQGSVFGGVQTNTNYYIATVNLDSKKITVSTSESLSPIVQLSTTTGNMSAVVQASSYKLRVRRINSSLEEDASGQGDYRNYHRCVYINSVGYSNNKPMLNPPGCLLAKTAIQIQSSNKVNGQIDGVNAIVETRGIDWDSTTNTFVTNRIINNPASLFMHVLTHPAIPLPYRVTNINTQIDTATISEWHEFCDGDANRPALRYNNVIADSRSIMDVLRDICAAGMASPTYIDGKWSVVIEKARTHVVQHFTPHNSWGFESTKTLPRIPDAFRINFVNEEKSYQQDELIVCNFGVKDTDVELIEELNLPGVTNAAQAKYLARFHFAQLKLRPETYTLNVDFEYLVCTRGDLVRVSHDVPLWGTGTGRIKSFNGTSVVLTDEVYLDSTKSYQIRIRTNNITTTAGTGYVLKTLVVASTGYYTNITLTQAIGNQEGVEIDNLYMIGETTKETQELIVLAIEPSSNLSARLTLVDYSPSIYSLDLNDDINSDLLAYSSNITLTNNSIVKNAITKSPIITGHTSNSSLSEQISPGNYQNVTIVSFTNPEDLGIQAENVQLEIIPANGSFDVTGNNKLYIVTKEQSSITIFGLSSGQVYKIRVRYTNSIGSVVGPWSDTKIIAIEGRSITLLSSPELTVDLTSHYLVILPTTSFTSTGSSINGTTLTIGNLSTGVPKVGMLVIAPGILPNTYIISGSGSVWQVDKSQTLASTALDGLLNNTDPSFKEYEFRVYKNSGSGDFWNLDTVKYNIKTVRNPIGGIFDLKEFPTPRISSTGIAYRVACRAVDKNDNYSTSSALGNIVITTIK